MSDNVWWQQPLRILQTVLRENDLADYNVTAVLDFCEQIHANTLVVNGGGVVDFSPTPCRLLTRIHLCLPARII